MDQMFSDRANQQKLTFAEKTLSASKQLTDDMRFFAQKIIVSSANLVQRAYGEPPCSFGVLLFGSLGRCIEGTPYSDIEFGFIVEHDDADSYSYFEKLAVDIYFRLGNLAESPLKLFYIPELFHKRHVFDATSDSMWFKDMSKSGFRFDGMTPKSGNIPTGSGLNQHHLTLTADQMMTRYRQCFKDFSSNRKINGDLADLMASMDLLHDFGNGRLLYEDFTTMRNSFESTVADDRHIMRANEKRIQTLQRDLEDHEFTPMSNLNTDFRRIQVKADILRFITLLALNFRIGLLQYQHVGSADELFRKLHEDGWISSRLSQSLLFILSSALWCRTSAYLQSGTQSDYISLLPKYKAGYQLNDDFHLPMQLFIPLTYMQAQLKRCIIAQREPSRYGRGSGRSIIGVIKTMLHEADSIDNHDFVLLSKLYHACGDSENGLRVISRKVKGFTGREFENLSPDETFNVMRSLLINIQRRSDAAEDSPVWEVVQTVAHLLFRLSKYEEARKYFNLSSNEPGLSSPLKACYTALSGFCLSMTSKPMESYIHILETNLELQRDFGVRNISEVINYIFSPTCKRSQEDILLASVGTMDIKLCREILEYHQGNARVHKKSWQTLKDIFHILVNYFTVINMGKHRVLADLMVSVGVRSELFGDYQSAYKWYSEAEVIFKEVQGKNAASLETAVVAVYKAKLLIKSGAFENAKFKCLEILEQFALVRIPSPIHELDCGVILIEAYLGLGNRLYAHSALEHYLTLADKIYSNSSGIIDRCKLGFLNARLLLMSSRLWGAKEVAEETYLMLEDYISQNSIAFLSSPRMPHDTTETVKGWLKGILPDKPYISSHPMLCEGRQILAEIYIKLDMLEEAELGLDTNLSDEGFDKAFGKDSGHPMISKTLMTCAKLKQRQGDLNAAMDYCERAIYILREKFTPKEQQVHQELQQCQSFYNELFMKYK